MFELLFNAISDIASVKTILFLVMGVMFGLVFGVIPGLGGTTALAILMPLTFGMNAKEAFAMVGGIMGAVAMGGAISAILLNTPGTAPNAATTLDGYPLAKQGRAAEAIGAAATASPLGGLFGVLTLLMVLPVAKELILLFGPPEFFLLAVFGLVTIALSDSSNLLRGLISAGVGLMLAFVGYDHLSITGGKVAGDAGTVKLHGVMKGIKATLRNWKIVIKGSLIGTIIGSIPGVGGTVATFIAYSTTKRADDDPESFGTGRIEGQRGVIAHHCLWYPGQCGNGRVSWYPGPTWHAAWPYHVT